MPLNKLTEKDIRRACGNTFYQWGLKYYRDDRVLDFDLVEGDHLIYASVSGSGRQVYEQVIQLSLQAKKQKLADGIYVDESPQAMTKLSGEDLLALFDH